MKIVHKFKALLSVIIVGLFPYTAQAIQSYDKKVDAKCYVEITGGIKTISFWATSPKKLKGLPKHIQGKKISAPEQWKRKTRISKVYECKLLNERFSSTAANNMDLITPR